MELVLNDEWDGLAFDEVPRAFEACEGTDVHLKKDDIYSIQQVSKTYCYTTILTPTESWVRPVWSPFTRKVNWRAIQVGEALLRSALDSKPGETSNPREG